MFIDSKKAEYTRWLLSELGADDCNYIFLSSCLNSIEFYYSKKDDKNRALDARELRNEYVDEFGDDVLEVLPTAVTALEVLCSMAKRADWIVRETPYTWFIIFLKNLGLDFLVDSTWTEDGESFVVATIHKWFDRRFSPSGAGSPWRSNTHDVTRISMWDAMQWYIADTYGEGHI